nr:RNA-directed DNA polymerase, eukaryota [Tanacetum cinerariifolium]
MVSRDLDNFVMGEVGQFSSLNNLRVLLHNEGFMDIEIVYLGGLWVMIKLGSAKTKLKFIKHMGVASWFVRLCNAQNDFVASDHIVWVDIEGVPLHAWSHATFHKIGSQWGEVMEIEEDYESVKNESDINVLDNIVNNEEEESDSEAVSDTYFEDNEDAQEHDNEFDQTLNDKEVIRKWVAEYKSIHSNSIRDVKNKLIDIDKLLDKGGVTDDDLLSRME